MSMPKHRLLGEWYHWDW